MQVYHLSAECYPAAKVGGLADVVGALPKYLCKSGVIAKVIMPAYHTAWILKNSANLQLVFEGLADLSVFKCPFQVLSLPSDVLGYELLFINIPGLFDRPGIYNDPGNNNGYHDEFERNLAFQVAALTYISHQPSLPDCIHCHDHHTGFVPFMIKECFVFYKLKQIPTVLTIHNGQYHGVYTWDKARFFPDFNRQMSGMLEWNNHINALATGIKSAWRVTTVSKGYLGELTWNANGLEPLMVQEMPKSVGITNGIDEDVWDPDTDSMLTTNYTIANVAEGKKANKIEVCENFGLNPELPLFVFIGRLVWEKGADLLPEIFYRTLFETNFKCNFLVLGTGDSNVEHALNALKGQFLGYFNTAITYNETLSHRLYAAADFLIMPSRVEPCGLNQLYALKYGTIPVVADVGGLRDTVIDFDEPNGYGIRFHKSSVYAAVEAIKRAIFLHQDQKTISNVIEYIMKINNSWPNATTQYRHLYQSLTSNG